MEKEKDIDWRGSSYEDLLAFPDAAKKTAGFELHRLQNGELPTNYKWVNRWGAGIIEIRLEEKTDAFRVVCIVKFEEAVYVLHSFQKKSQKTSKEDKGIIEARYKGVIAERSKKR